MKAVLAALAAVSILTLCSCGTSGSQDYTPKNRYKDGTYYFLSRKLDNDSLENYMRIRVKNNIITSVYFNRIDMKGREHIKKNSRAHFFIQRLNTDFLQAQSAKFQNPDEGNGELYRIYRTLAKNGLKELKNAQTELIYVDIDYVYTAKSSSYGSDGYRGQMSATFENAKISQLSYVRKNRNGKNALEDRAFLSSFRNQVGVGYSKYVSRLTAQSRSRASVIYAREDFETARDFNQLAKKINQKSRTVNYRKIRKYLAR